MMSMTYVQVLMAMLISSAITMTMVTASYLLGDTAPDKEKVSVYECGFSPFDNPGNPVSISFFLMGMLFLMFDLEVSLMFPWSVSSYVSSLHGIWVVFLFLLMLIWGLIYEWIKGGLEWE